MKGNNIVMFHSGLYLHPLSFILLTCFCIHYLLSFWLVFASIIFYPSDMFLHPLSCDLLTSICIHYLVSFWPVFASIILFHSDLYLHQLSCFILTCICIHYLVSSMMFQRHNFKLLCNTCVHTLPIQNTTNRLASTLFLSSVIAPISCIKNKLTIISGLKCSKKEIKTCYNGGQITSYHFTDQLYWLD